LTEIHIEKINIDKGISYPEFVYPLIHSSIPEYNLFVCDNNKIIAWIIVDIKDNEEIHCKYTYVNEQYRSMALGICLWHELFKRMDNDINLSNIKLASLSFDSTNNTLYKLYDILFSKCIVDTYKHLISEKHFLL
jgi:hypothetical protein